MKHFIGVAMLVVLALVGRFWMFQRIFLGYMHGGTFRAGVSLGTIVFWLLMGVAAVWLVIAAYKFGRHRTITPQHFADELERHLLGTEGNGIGTIPRPSRSRTSVWSVFDVASLSLTVWLERKSKKN
jgi:hypothetical protein